MQAEPDPRKYGLTRGTSICPPNRVRLHRDMAGPTDMHTALAQLPRRARMPAQGGVLLCVRQTTATTAAGGKRRFVIICCRTSSGVGLVFAKASRQA